MEVRRGDAASLAQTHPRTEGPTPSPQDGPWLRRALPGQPQHPTCRQIPGSVLPGSRQPTSRWGGWVTLAQLTARDRDPSPGLPLLQAAPRHQLAGLLHLHI